jgi:hypothetical protein
LIQLKSDLLNTQNPKSPGIEEWREILGEENYQASSEGRIRNKKTGRILKQHKVQANSKTYLKVTMGRRPNKNGKNQPKQQWVHRMVCLAFHGKPPIGKEQVCHVPDDNGLNNRASNLMWGSRSWNESHKNGNAVCECEDKAVDHVDCDGYCTVIKPDGKYCECMEFRIKKEE